MRWLLLWAAMWKRYARSCGGLRCGSAACEFPQHSCICGGGVVYWGQIVEGGWKGAQDSLLMMGDNEIAGATRLFPVPAAA